MSCLILILLSLFLCGSCLSICVSLVSLSIHPLYLYLWISCFSVYASLVSLVFHDICHPSLLSISLSLPVSLRKEIIKHRWASTLILMSAISDFWHLLFQYRKKICRTETVIPISTSEFFPIYDIKIIFNIAAGFNPQPVIPQASALPLNDGADLWPIGCQILQIG